MDLVGAIGFREAHNIGAAPDRGLQILLPELRVKLVDAHDVLDVVIRRMTQRLEDQQPRRILLVR